jgi:hypothetical protein
VITLPPRRFLHPVSDLILLSGQVLVCIHIARIEAARTAAPLEAKNP